MDSTELHGEYNVCLLLHQLGYAIRVKRPHHLGVEIYCGEPYVCWDPPEYIPACDWVDERGACNGCVVVLIENLK